MSLEPHITPFFEEATNTVTYLVADPVTKSAAVIDPVSIMVIAAARSIRP